MSTIAVVGASGTIGSRLVPRLQQRGHRVRAISRTPGPASEGLDLVAADLTDPDEAVRALDGADAVYLTPPLGGAEPLALETEVTGNVIEAARKHAVGHVVMHTALQADRGDTGCELLDNKTRAEQRLATSGVGYTILRPAWFLQNLWAARDYLHQGVLSLPWPGDMVWGATDADDLVTAAAALLDRGPANRGFDLHIPGGVTGQGLASAAGAVLGRQVAYQEAQATPRQYVDAFPISDAHKELYAGLFDHFRAATYLGDPEPVARELDGFAYHGAERFFRDELFPQA